MKKNTTQKTNNRSKIIYFVALAIIILVNLYLLAFNYQTVRNLSQQNVENQNQLNYTLPELNISDNPLSLEGFTKVNINMTEEAVIVEANCTSLGLVTNDVQLYSIRQGLEKSIDRRPTIHDTTRAILDNFNISIFMIKITDAKDELYFSNIYLKSGDSILNIDAKPSDAIALAIRTNAPVYIKETLLEEFGEKVC